MYKHLCIRIFLSPPVPGLCIIGRQVLRQCVGNQRHPPSTPKTKSPMLPPGSKWKPPTQTSQQDAQEISPPPQNPAPPPPDPTMQPDLTDRVVIDTSNVTPTCVPETSVHYTETDLLVYRPDLKDQQPPKIIPEKAACESPNAELTTDTAKPTPSSSGSHGRCELHCVLEYIFEVRLPCITATYIVMSTSLSGAGD